MAATEKASDTAILITDDPRSLSIDVTVLRGTIDTTNEPKSDEVINVEPDEILDEVFYIYYKNEVTGPHYQTDILKLYLGHEIKHEIWVKNIKDSQKETKWCKINLLYEQIDDNKEFEIKHPKLYNYLIPRIKSRALRQYGTPINLPIDAGDSIGTQILQILGKIIAIITGVIVTSHIIATLCPALCCFYLCGKIYGQSLKSQAAMLLFGCLGFVIIPPILVYIVLLGAVDYNEWNGEIQSWMISYIAWGCFTYLACSSWIVATFIASADKAEYIHKAVFYVVGVRFPKVDMETLEESLFGMAMVSLFPAVAALLPAAIIGFISNYILEEKFELKCNEEIVNDSLCFDDHYGCCEVISSHDLRNSYSFIGGFTSNILATWAFIRIIGYLMVNMSPKVAIFAKRER